MKESTIYVAVWLLTTLIAVLMALNMNTAAFVDGSYIPVGNDSFYHARRIIDAATSDRGFYQFDQMIHVPEGSWLNWPWGYDYFMALALSSIMAINPSVEPMAFLAHVPVAWLLVNAGLISLICWQIGLRPFFTAIALLGYALSPLTQTMHGVGIIDHHFIEQSFVLVTALAGLRFFRRQSRPSDPIILGFILGIAPAFHNGLFIVQVPVLLCFLVLWVRGEFPDRSMANRLAITLFLSTLVVSIPSEPFRDMQFEFWTLSWFHLYIACATATCIACLSRMSFSKQNALLFVMLGIILAIPLFAKILVGASFLSGEMTIIREVHEVKSPFRRLIEPGGLIWITSFYSWLFFLVPVLIVMFMVRLRKRADSLHLFLSIISLFGLLLMLAQYRFHPYGSWVMLVGSLFFAQEISDKLKLTTIAIVGATVLLFVLAYQPPVKNRLFQRYPPGNTADYAATRSLYPSLSKSCAEESGIAVSYNDDGHYIRYHTDCSVISNNFLMTPQHEEKVLELDRLLQLDPEQFLEAAPDVDYIFARMFQIFSADENGMVSPTPIPKIVSVNAPLFVALTFAEELPKEYVLLDEVRVEDERDFAFGRVYKIVRD